MVFKIQALSMDYGNRIINLRDCPSHTSNGVRKVKCVIYQNLHYNNIYICISLAASILLAIEGMLKATRSLHQSPNVARHLQH